MKILITRPHHEAKNLAAALLQDAIEIQILPLLEIQPLSLSCPNPIFDISFKDAQFIFVSKNAVLGYPYPPHSQLCFAVGKSTAIALEQAGFTNVIYPAAGAGSEALLNLRELHNIAGKHFIISQGTQSRKKIEHTLKQRGAKVTNLITYASISHPLNINDVKLLKYQYDLMIVTSTTVLKYLAKLAHQHNPALFAMPITILTERMLESARQLGFSSPIIVNGFDDKSIINKIRSLQGHFHL